MKKIKNPWSFVSPSYDNLRGPAVDAGSHYGVGPKSRVGNKIQKDASPIPIGVICKDPLEVILSQNPKDEI